MGNNGTIIIIDGNSLINRAYYAMQRPMITKEGLYTQGVYGFLNMLNKIIKDYEPTHIAVAFDLKEPTFRHKQYEEYKAGRKKMPMELAMQIPLLKELLTAMNIKIFECPGYEADDIIGTIAKAAETQNLQTLVITGDKDALQLASQKTKIIITKKGISEFDVYDYDKMLEVYGMTPAQFIDYKGLRGDTSDNIPGIPGVGEKTAMKLLAEFGSIEELIANTNKITNAKMRQKIEDNAHLAIMSKNLATIITTAPIDLNFNDLKVKEPNYSDLINIYVKLEFNSFLKKLNINEIEQKNQTSLKNIQSDSYLESITLHLSTAIENVISEITEDQEIYVKILSDGNHRDHPLILGVGILIGNNLYYFNGDDLKSITRLFVYISSVKAKLCGHDLKSDYYALMSHIDFDGEEKIKGNAIIFNTFYDTQIAEYVIDSAKSNYDIKTLVYEYLHKEIKNEKEFISENCQLDMFTDNSKAYGEYLQSLMSSIREIKRLQESKLTNGLDNVAFNLEFPLIEVLASMEVNGFKLDANALLEIGDGIKKRILELTSEIYEYSGEEFNINSTQQLGMVLFEKLGLPAGKKTKKGYSTGADVLEKLIDKHPIIALILEYRQITKLNSTYIEGLIPLKAADGRIHAHFNQTVTATGRISCTEPNLQNIPIRQELGRQIRKAFISSCDDNILIGADYSQIELRVLAAMSGEEQLIEAFNNDEDIHKLTAARVFNVSMEEVTSLQRSNAKAVNFGVIYGMSGFGLSTELNITRKEAEKYIQDYFNKYSKVKSFMDEQIKNCREKGYSCTIMNRKRAIHEINASNYMVRSLGERLAMNTPIQGSAADIIKLAMIKVYKELRKNCLETKLILQVHDELILDVPSSEIEEAKKILKECMETAISLPVKLTADLEIGKNWFMLK